MNLREKVEEQLLLNGYISCMEIAKKVQVDKEKTKYFPGEVNTILRALIKKGKVEVSDKKGPRGGQIYRLNTIMDFSNPIDLHNAVESTAKYYNAEIIEEKDTTPYKFYQGVEMEVTKLPIVFND